MQSTGPEEPPLDPDRRPTVPADLDRMVRDGVRDGRAALAALDAWGSLDDWVDRHPEVVRSVVEAAAELDPALALSERAAAPGIGIALIGGGGGVQADARFRRWIGDPAASVDCMRLLRGVREGRREIGLVQTERHGVISVYATPGDSAQAWLSLFEREARAGGAERRPASAVLVAFAPSRSVEAVERATAVYGLTPIETRVVQALLDAPSVEAAALAAGVGREAAKDALAAALRKAGVASAAQLVACVVELSGPSGEAGAQDAAALGAVLGLSPTETRVARRIAAGESAKSVAAQLGLSPQTVATYRRSVFAKTGVNRARDLGRLLAEVRGLGQLTGASEIVLESGETAGRLRAVIDGAGRRVVFLDYGPKGAPATVLLHGSATGRTAPPPLLAQLQARGRRVIVPQRPGYGLTHQAVGAMLLTASADLALVLDHLGCGAVELIARSSAPAFDFVLRHPERVLRWLLVNTQTPWAREPRSRNALYAVAGAMFQQPALIEPFGRMLVRQSRSDLVASLLRRVAADVPADRRCLNDPDTLAHLVNDAQGLLGPGMAGFIAEQRLYAEGWSAPTEVSGRGLVLVRSEGLHGPRSLHSVAPHLTEARTVTVAGAGWFVPFTHPDALVALLDD